MLLRVVVFLLSLYLKLPCVKHIDINISIVKDWNINMEIRSRDRQKQRQTLAETSSKPDTTNYINIYKKCKHIVI